MAASTNQELPKDLTKKFASVDESLTGLENILQPLLSTPRQDVYDKIQPLDRAKLDLMLVYGINSLFWMYLNVSGVNPKTHAVRGELERIRTYMNRVKEIQDKLTAPKVNKPAAQRFVKSALWQAAHKTSAPCDEANGGTNLTQGDIIPQKKQKMHKLGKAKKKNKNR